MLVNTYGYTRVSYATVLKKMTVVLLEGLGLSEDEIKYYMTDGKEEPMPKIDRSVRYITRYLGTEFGRELIDDKLWLKCAHATMVELGLNTKHDVRIVFDDLRFVNEYKHLRFNNVLLIKVSRKVAEAQPLLERASLVTILRTLYRTAPSKWGTTLRQQFTRRHASDGALDKHCFDHYIENDTTFDALAQNVVDLLSDTQNAVK